MWRSPILAKISWHSLWTRSITLWSLHTENTWLISCWIIFNVLRPIWSRYFNVMGTFCQFCGMYGITDLEFPLRGHPRSLILSPIHCMHMTSCWSSIVTLVLSCHVSEILELLYAESRLFDNPSLFWPKFQGVPLGVSPWCWGFAESEYPRLTNH